MFEKYGISWKYGHISGKKWNWDAVLTIVKRKKWFVGLVVSGDATYFSVGVRITKSQLVLDLGFLTFRIYWQ